MGLFRRRTVIDRPLTEQEAFAGILIAAAACDGRARRESIASVRTSLRRMKLLADVTDSHLRAITDTLLYQLKREGPLRLMDRCASTLSISLRDCAFANACDRILEDRVVESTERDFLKRLQTALAVDGDTAFNIVEAMIAKNKG
jgi:hypothetical protein